MKKKKKSHKKQRQNSAPIKEIDYSLENQQISTGRTYTSSVLLKLGLLTLLLAIIGLPINTIFDFSLLLIIIIFLITANIKTHKKKWVLCLLAVLSLRLVLWLIPDLDIQEGHNYFTYKDRNEVLEQNLPKPVFEFGKKMLRAQYPTKGRACDDKAYCWGHSTIINKTATYPGPKETFAFSGDAIFQQAKYSRVVDSIDFSDQNTQRADFLNARHPAYWYWFGNPKLDGIIPRDRVPQFVLYEFPQEAIGGQFCWQGYMMWQQSGNNFEAFFNKEKKCKTLTARNINKQIYGFSIIYGSPLKIKFTPPIQMRIWQIIESLLKILAIAGLLFLLLDKNWRSEKQWWQIGILATISLIIAAMLNHWDIYNQLVFRVHQAGNDGSTYLLYAREMLVQLLAGNFVEFLRGTKDVFYFMPGLRYFRAIEQIIFGSTNFGYILLLFFMVLFLWKFINVFFKNKYLSFGLLAVFVLTPYLEVFGFSLGFYNQVVIAGFPGTAAYAFLLIALYLIFNYFDDKDQFIYFSYWAGLTLALAVFIRPNLALMMAVFLAGLFILLIFQKRYKEMFVLGIGFSFILFVPLHNLYFGHRFVPLTDAAFISANFITPPSVYWQALQDLFSGETSNLTQHVYFRWQWWSQGKYDFLRFNEMFPAGVKVFLHLLIFGAALIGLLYRKINLSAQLKIFILAVFVQHISMFMWRPSYRYSAIIWLLTFIIALIVGEKFYRLKFKK